MALTKRKVKATNNDALSRMVRCHVWCALSRMASRYRRAIANRPKGGVQHAGCAAQPHPRVG